MRSSPKTTGTFTITKDGGGTAPIGDLQTLLRGITYDNASDNPTTTHRTIAVTANDGTVDSDTATATITVADVPELLVYWDFEGNTDDTATGGVRADNGALTGTAFATAGIGNNALQFSGNRDLMTVASSPDINLVSFAKKSISLWFYPQDLNNGTQVLYQEGGYVKGLNLYLQDGKVFGGAWDTNSWDGTSLSSANVQPNQWNHVTLTLDSSTFAVKLYVNGDAPQVGFANLIGPHNPATLGGATRGTRFDDGNGGFVNTQAPSSYTGLLDDVRIYDGALSDADVNLLSSATPNPPPSGDIVSDLWAHRDFDGLERDLAVECQCDGECVEPCRADV